MSRVVLAALVFCATPAFSETDFTALSDGERLLFGAEVRATLLAHPEIIERALTPQPYAEEINSDLALIAKHSTDLFGGKDLVLFVGPNCETCAGAQTELTALAKAKGLTVNILNLEDTPALQAALEIDTLPFYVLPDKMLRGAMPAPVLERFLNGL